jgi:hypothetical protein
MTEIWHATTTYAAAQIIFEVVFTIGARTYAFSLLQYSIMKQLCVCWGGGGDSSLFFVALAFCGPSFWGREFFNQKVVPREKYRLAREPARTKF